MAIDEPSLTHLTDPPVVIDLDDDAALDTQIVGGKAAALAQARRAGITTLPGAILTTTLSARVDAGLGFEGPDGTDIIAEVLERMGEHRTLIARSSSVVEDTASGSMAGQFASVPDVSGHADLRRAVEVVYASRARARAPTGGAPDPIAVLVQPMVRPSVSGVYFGVDPVSGRSDRRLVAAVRGAPDRLVSGEVDGSHWILDPSARVVDRPLGEDVSLPRGILRRLVGVGDHLARLFDGPQDVEWAVVAGELIVLQSRPVTTEVHPAPAGPVYGPGPVAETFPEALSPLEIDLWVGPLRDGLREALRISGGIAERDLERRDLVVTVDGQVAIDLHAAGEIEERAGLVGGVAVRVRRLRSAWRIGRLRVALPVLGHDVCARADADLEEVPPFGELATRQLVALVGRGQVALRSLHAHEILTGLVSGASSSSFTGASVALRLLVESRRDGLSDEEIVRRAPAVLALVPPRIGPKLELPEVRAAADLRPGALGAEAAQVSREALRLRIRWMQELIGQAAHEIGRRLVARGELDRPDRIASLSFDELASVASWQATVAPGRFGAGRSSGSSVGVPRQAALPARFQLSASGAAIAIVEQGAAGGGTGAGGGSARGIVTHDAAHPPEGSILVVRTLTPQLGPILPLVAGIVAETGSVLSHLAILAREAGVAAVVGHRGAVEELSDGTLVTVDGTTGQVTKGTMS